MNKLKPEVQIFSRFKPANQQIIQEDQTVWYSDRTEGLETFFYWEIRFTENINLFGSIRRI